MHRPLLHLFLAVAVGLLAPTVTAHAEIQVTGPVAGTPALDLADYDLAARGLIIEEFFMAGTATAYQHRGAVGADGHWQAVAADTAPYKTRLVVVRPADPAKFNGTVVVEWLNVSRGMDMAADWASLHRELIRDGYAYVAVSAQKVGIDGFGGSDIPNVTPLKRANPARYGQLRHPGDAYAFDIYSQAATIVRGEGSAKVLGPLSPKRVIATGVSQSAIFLTTYVNAVDPIAKAYDGFLLHARFGGAVPVEVTRDLSFAAMPPYVRLRDDMRVPVLTVVTETEVMNGFAGARQPDTSRIHTWEITGAAHADTYFFGVAPIDSGDAPIARIAAGYAPTDTLLGMTFAKPINAGPQHHFVAMAALHRLNHWIATGEQPPHAEPLALMATIGAPGFALDANGNSKGGVRTPWVDVPTARLSGIGNRGGEIASLVGVTEPFDGATLRRLYPGGRDDYLRRFDDSLAQAVTAGFILPDDVTDCKAIARALYPEAK